MKIEAEVEHSPYGAEEEGGGGCSVEGAETTPSAQERPSIDRPEWQPPGCGGCGSDSDHHRNGPTSVFDCEHFQFIDEDDDEGVICDDVPSDEAAPEDPSPAPAGVSRDEHRTRDDDHNMGESESSAARKGHAVKRQVSFDDAAMTKTAKNKKELKSLLKRPATTGKGGKKNRVTFDEAVTLYSDENNDVQMLQLTTGPDIIYSDCYYMFEPPIEYQDVPPFDPPAEYRDCEEAFAAPASEPAVADTPQTSAPQQPTSDKLVSENTDKSVVVEPVGDEQTRDSDVNCSVNCDVAVSADTTNADCASGERVPSAAADGAEVSETSLESDKVFERFLEAEREFAVDEELNSVFRALENDFVNDDKNGALDDNFFRKLITLLSSAEGDPTAVNADFLSDFGKPRVEAEDDENSQTPSRTLSEADSDCSISSQDTIIVRMGEDESDQNSSDSVTLSLSKPVDAGSRGVSETQVERLEGYDEVFAEISKSAPDERPRPLPRDSVLIKSNHVSQVVAQIEKANEESLSRQSSGEQSVNSVTSQDHPQDADDSTSSDSRSGEVEEEIRLDDLGYDEEDAEDYDEESFRGMARGSSKIRRIIKKNALQCTLFKGIEAKRRQQPGAKYPRPKSPLLSQESLVEKLKWLTTIDEHKDADGPLKFHSKPPDVILSTGGVPVNGSIPHSGSSENDLAQGYHPSYYQAQARHMMAPSSQAGYYVRRDGFPVVQHPSLPRQRQVAYQGHPSQMMHTLPHPQNRGPAHPSASQAQQQWAEQQRPASSMSIPRSFRDWRVIQRIIGGRSSSSSSSDDRSRNSQVQADYVRNSNGSISAYPVSSVPPDVSRTSQNKDELEQFVEKDSKRMELIRKRYSVAEEDEDPTFGFARRPSVKGVQKQIQSKPSENVHIEPYVLFEDQVQGPPYQRPAYSNETMRVYNRDPNWRPDSLPQTPQALYGPQVGRTQVPMHVHRASVALTELPGSATLPYSHRKPPDVRYHSYAESMYGSTRTLPTNEWLPPELRTYHAPKPIPAHQTLPLQVVPPPMLQVPPHSKDERGVPEGASSSPKISSDSLYHAPVPDSIAAGGPHKDDGMIYYSLNV